MAERPQLNILMDDLNALVDKGLAHVPAIDPKYSNALGIAACLAAAYLSYKESPKAYLVGAGAGFVLSMKDVPSHPFDKSLKEKTLLSIWAEDKMPYQKAIPILWILGWNWGLATGFLAGHTVYHLSKTHVDAAVAKVKGNGNP
ncbi:MAG: hypothetical protein KDK76_06550 [Chlamydiia bacterium]|nr:hypothetical protein [Chlamydiia bacterium]